MAKKPTPRLFLRASLCGHRMIEAHDSVIAACAFRNRQRRLAQSIPEYRRSSDAPDLDVGVWKLFHWRLGTLAAAYDSVCGWWVGHQAPSFEPKATCALEGILWWATRLSAHLGYAHDFARPEHFDATVRFVLAHCSSLPTAEVTALLRMETKRCLDGLPSSTRQPSGRRPVSEVIESECGNEGDAHLPKNWDSLSVEEKLASFESEAPLTLGHRAGTMGKGLPSWDPDRKVLKVGQVIVKPFHMGPPPKNQSRILEAMNAAGWPENRPVVVEEPKGSGLKIAACAIGEHLSKQGIRFWSPRPGYVMWERVQDSN